jgi:hypothetical protein
VTGVLSGAQRLTRAGIAFFGPGANVSEDALYPTATVDADGSPARAFWSLTM